MTHKKKDLSRFRDLVGSVRIDHDAYASILEELKGAYDDIGHTATPVFLLITGESRTGKSSVVRDMLETYLPQQVDDRIIRSVLYAVAPAKATVKSLLESLLKGLGDPHWSRGSESAMTQRLYTLLDAVECRMIILDEFQHLCDKGQMKKLDQLADWLKVLLETRNYGLVAVGLPSAASVVHKHPQLVGRFDEALRMPVFDWGNKTSAAQFRGVLRQFQKELHPFQMPPLDGKEMGLRMYLASAGRIGLLAKLLDRAVRNAIRAQTLEIRLEDFSKAYARAIWSAHMFPVTDGPFGAGLEQLSQKGVQEIALQNAAMELVADESAAVEVHGSKREDDRTVANPEAEPSVRRNQQKTKAGHSRPMRKRPGVKRELGRAF
mgnify:CR=1 FL=1